MSVAVKGWHPGERSILSRVGYAEVSAMSYTWITGYMPEQHRQFHVHNLPFVPLTTIDSEGRPWASLVAGASGESGFISSASEIELSMDVKLWKGDPMLQNLKKWDNGKILIAGLGIEFPSRRRNKFAGYVTEVEETGEVQRHLKLVVNQAIGNCPKYINIRDLVPHPSTNPIIGHDVTHMSAEERLPQDLINFIVQSDTVFFGTTYEAKKKDAKRFPSHVGMNSRGGLPGFIRVMPSDGRTVVMPDYSGNRLLTSLGNVEASGLAAMSFLNFENGDILYLTGKAENLVGQEAQSLVPRQNVLTTLHVEGYIFIRDALPVRQRPGSSIGRSPYSPPVKYLAEERGSSGTSFNDVQVTLTSIKILSLSLATFSFETSRPINIKPGQAAVLDFQDLLGKQKYAHMAPPGSEARINDDRIRTWTVSSAHVDGKLEDCPTNTFDLTMREMEGGLVTGAMFSLTRQAAARMPSVLEDARPLGFTVRLVGISGEFTLPVPKLDSERINLIWIAGGIGVTPFLSMLSALSRSLRASQYNIAFVLSTREPEVLLPLIQKVVGECQFSSSMLLHLFSKNSPKNTLTLPSNVTVRSHVGRVDDSPFLKISPTTHNAYLCGPLAFEETMIKILTSRGFKAEEITREGFAY